MAAMSSCDIDGRKCGPAGRAAFVALGAGLWAVIGGAIDNSVDKRVTLYDGRPKKPDPHVRRNSRLPA